MIGCFFNSSEVLYFLCDLVVCNLKFSGNLSSDAFLIVQAVNVKSSMFCTN
jgi:hypothetical protein